MEEKVDEIIATGIASWPDRTAVIHKNRAWSYAELGNRAEELKGRLTEAGLSPGDRAVLRMENSAEYIAAYLAILGLGGVVVPLHPQLPAAEVSNVIRRVGAAGLLQPASARPSTPDGFNPAGLKFILMGEETLRFEGPAAGGRSAEGLAQIIFTSGSTGAPKGVMLSHGNLVGNTKSILEYLPLNSDDRIVAVLPFAYAYGNSVMLTHLFAGATLILENSFVYPNLVIERMRKERATGFSGVASTYALLLGQSDLKGISFPALRYLTHAGGPIPAGLLERLRSAFPGKAIYLMYGQTEGTARLTYLSPEEIDRKKGSVGRPISGVSLKIEKEPGKQALPGEVGEVCVAGKNVMQGYWGDPEGTARVLIEGWLRTGDLGCVDEEGFLTLVGRNNQMIKSGAFRISPIEIEEVLLRHPDVREAGVVGVEDEILGEMICGIIVPKENRRPTDNELLTYCSQHLAPYKRPKIIHQVAELPKSPSGKVLREALRGIASMVKHS